MSVAIREEIAKTLVDLYKRGLTTPYGGNISVKDPDDNMIYVSPGSIPKGEVLPTQISKVDLAGELISGTSKPTCETGMHLAYYINRKDVGAVVHTHSPYSTMFAVANKMIDFNHAEEPKAIIGSCGFVEYIMFGTPELAAAVSKQTMHNACLLYDHGVICVGENLKQALYRLEVLEAIARLRLGAAVLKLGL